MTSTGEAIDKIYQEEVRQTEIQQETLGELKANRKANEKISKQLENIEKKLNESE